MNVQGKCNNCILHCMQTKCVCSLRKSDTNFSNCFFDNFFFYAFGMESSLIDLPLKERYIWLHTLSLLLSAFQISGQKLLFPLAIKRCLLKIVIDLKKSHTEKTLSYVDAVVCMRTTVLVLGRFIPCYNHGFYHHPRFKTVCLACAFYFRIQRPNTFWHFSFFFVRLLHRFCRVHFLSLFASFTFIIFQLFP